MYTTNNVLLYYSEQINDLYLPDDFSLLLKFELELRWALNCRRVVLLSHYSIFLSILFDDSKFRKFTDNGRLVIFPTTCVLKLSSYQTTN